MAHILLRFSTSRYMERYINDRFLQIEFKLKIGVRTENSKQFRIKKELLSCSEKICRKWNDGIGVTRKTSDPNNKAGHEFVSFKIVFVGWR